MTVNWRGAPNLDAAKKRALEMAADQLLDDAIVLSPTESGRMDASARTAVEGNEAAVGFTTDYAVIQHQRRDLDHDDGRPGFLAEAVENLPFEQIVGEQLRRTIGG